jgi:hypothetical protein
MSKPGSIFDDVHQILKDARRQVSTSVNNAMVEAYWRIGKRIVEEEQNGEQRAEYGAYVIKELAK